MARILDISPDDYHKRDGLSSTIATIAVTRSPRHAMHAHPVLGSGGGKEPTKATDTGSVVHALTLGKGKRFAVLDFNNYQTKLAQQARDAAREQGLIPILAEAYGEAEKAAAAISIELADRGIYLDGQSEVAVEWEEPSSSGPVLCRAMFDHVWLDTGRILDLKVTHDASPEAVARSAENYGYAVQAHAYQRALVALRPELAGRTEFLLAFCEPEAPFAMNLCAGDGSFRELGRRRWERAVETWGRCLAECDFPAFGSGINYISPPGWVMAREEFAA